MLLGQEGELGVAAAELLHLRGHRRGLDELVGILGALPPGGNHVIGAGLADVAGDGDEDGEGPADLDAVMELVHRQAPHQAGGRRPGVKPGRLLDELRRDAGDPAAPLGHFLVVH